MATALIVFSHLRWDFVYQRPQQLLSRLARHLPVIFIEEPVYDENAPHMKTYSPLPNLVVCQPHTPVNMPGFHDDQLPHLQKLIRQPVGDYDSHIAWFYTPMALPLLQELEPELVVYDCMDELASFMHAPKQLQQRESALLKAADLVFTGGPSLYRAKRDRHPNVHCFPSSVDREHFMQALDHTNSHPAHRDIPGPRLGYYGVIDERFDAPLVEALADAHPMWQIVLVGPVVKIDPSTLPQRANIHYLGQQPYDALPQFLAGWDVCLLPFALNEATRYISPTKTLEYMAAELPVVSTPVSDVVDVYGDIVTIAADPKAFVAACEAALLAAPEERARKVDRMREILAATSWDATAGKMLALLETTPRTARKAAAALPEADMVSGVASINRLPVADAARFARTVIVGAGPTGLSAAYHLGHDALLLEKNDMVGGNCRSIRDKGFTFDHAGHVMQAEDPYVLELYELLLGSNMHWQEREAWIHAGQRYTRYPSGRPAPASAGSAARGSDDGKVASLERRGPLNFEEFICQAWGEPAAQAYALPYNRKLWGMPLTGMDACWAERSTRLPDIEQMMDGAWQPLPEAAGQGLRFAYPLRGGFQALMSAFVPHIKGTIELNADVVRISPKQRIVTLGDGRRYQYENLISTLPLPLLVRMTGDEAPEEVRTAAAGLRHVSIRCINLGIGRANLTDKHWIYYPDDTVFHRVFAQGNASPECNPAGGFGLSCEISYSPAKPLPAEGEELIALCIRDCKRAGLLHEDDPVLAAHAVDIPFGHVIHDHARQQNVDTIKSWLSKHDIILAGRYSEWEYYNADHAFIAGRKAAQALRWLEKRSAVAAE